MWTLRICPKGCEQFNTFVGDYLSIEWLFAQFKTTHPDAHFQLENTITGAVTGPHDGGWFPEWFNREGLVVESDSLLTESYIELQRKARDDAAENAEELLNEWKKIQEEDLPT